MHEPDWSDCYERAERLTVKAPWHDVPTGSSDDALYARLTTRLLGVMQRVGLTHAQMHEVIAEFFAASQELADHVQDELADMAAPAREPEPVQWRSVQVHCRACRRDLGLVTVPLDLADKADNEVCCTGCQREGR